MKDSPDFYLEEARRVLLNEAAALEKTAADLDGHFARLAAALVECRGGVILVGMGKSGWIARKISATLNSTGTRSVYLHPAEAIHGDLGIIQPDDFVLLFSHSGETDEVLQLVPSLRRMGVGFGAVTGNRRSSLANLADHTLGYSMDEEACPLGLAPMTSTTCMLALGDALASVLMIKKEFTREDFGHFHPGGSLGRGLVQVKDVMLRDNLPVCSPDAPLRDVLGVMISANMGAVLIVDSDRLAGIISDGDVKRILASGSGNEMHEAASRFMTARPVTIDGQLQIADALEIMHNRVIYILPVVEDGRPVGLLRMHDILSMNPRLVDRPESG